MSKVFHISPDGVPRECSAISDESCRWGGVHFESLDEAKTYAELKNAEEAVKTDTKSVEYEKIFTPEQRRKMFIDNPSMSMVHPLGTILISKRGALWELKKRDQIGGLFDHKFTLKSRANGKKVVVSTLHAKEEGEKSLKDFSQLSPNSFTIDGPPIMVGTGLSLVPEGRHSLNNAFIARIRVETAAQAPTKENQKARDLALFENNENSNVKSTYRYIVADNFREEAFNDEKGVEKIAFALWSQAGRTKNSFKDLPDNEKQALLRDSKIVNKAKVERDKDKVEFTNQDLKDNQFDSFWLPGTTNVDQVSFLE